MRFAGKLKTWNDDRGFGFVEPEQGGQELFVHIKDFPSGTGRPSLLTFLVYAFDKSAAVSGRWRTAEQTLHLFGLIGGWPGALLAQQLLRHKTSKQSFISVFWFTVILNVCAFVLWHSGVLPLPRPPGAA
jgi:uncharacterized membrane protein YsdA (DUF1294 family)